ncbi:MAG: ferritin [Chloroflexi bacterium]|nr:ferritin [Chloroflexota bacterium]
MFSQKLQDAINEQINAEYYSAYMYLAMSAWLEERDFPGFAHWMRLQYEEEVVHALKFFDFMVERDAHIELKAIAAPPSDYKSVLDVFERTLAHEQHVTSLINNLYQLALEEGDYPSQVLLQWFINEQVEEEKNARDAIAQLRHVGDSGVGLIMLDREMATRQPSPEVTGQNAAA